MSTRINSIYKALSVNKRRVEMSLLLDLTREGIKITGTWVSFFLRNKLMNCKKWDDRLDVPDIELHNS